MISPIPNQPISFVQSLVKGCDIDAERRSSYIATTDELRFQVKYLQCGDTPNLVSDSMIYWTPQGLSWRFSGSGACITEGMAGAGISYPAFEPVPGTAYRIVIDAVNFVGQFILTVGGNDFTLTGDAGYDLFFIAGTNQFPVIYPLNDESSGCIQDGVYIYEMTAELTVRFMQGADELYSVNYADEPEYFSFVNGGINVIMPMSVTGIAVGECFTIEMTDDCDDVTLVSQQFRAVSADDCKYLAIRACNDYDAMGFANPFSPRIRIPATLARPRYQYETNDERHSNGRNYRSFADRDREMTLGTDPLNEDDHSFLSALPLFSHVYIGNDEMFFNADTYEPAYGDVWSATGAVQMQVKFKQELLRNVQCGPELEGCAPVNDPICNIPSILFSWTDNILRANLTSNAGFLVDTIRVISGEFDSGEQHYPGIPSSLYYGPFPDGQLTTIYVTNLTMPTCNYRRDLYVPVFACPGPMFTIGGDNAFIALETSTGYIRYRAADGVMYGGMDSNEYELPGGTYCSYSSSGFDETVGSGYITTFTAGGISSIDTHGLNAVQQFRLDESSVTYVDLSIMIYATIIILDVVEEILSIDVSQNTLLDLLRIRRAPLITSLDLTGLTALKTLDVQECDLLSSITLDPAMLLQQVLVTDAAIDATIVDALINRCDASHAFGVLNLSGGTNASPTAASDTNRLALIANGWTVTTN